MTLTNLFIVFWMLFLFYAGLRVFRSKTKSNEGIKKISNSHLIKRSLSTLHSRFNTIIIKSDSVRLIQNILSGIKRSVLDFRRS